MSASSTSVDLVVHASDSEPRVKQAPTRKGLGTPFVYNPSSDGTDENLVVLLHGLGDTEVPFGKLGKSLNLPQTATLALRAPERVPFLYEDAFQWYESFDPMGDLLERPNPSAGLAFLTNGLKHLTTHCGWRLERIHLFGFAQGGSLAGEFALAQRAAPLASVVSVCGPLLSFPTLATPCTGTRVMVFDRVSAERSRRKVDEDARAWRKGFERVVVEVRQGGEGMLRGREEWQPVMAFWSDVLAMRAPEGAYGVSGS
ncbi:hypothetical protein EXIGLDRAFT_713813 [Exidia glandulosa HHB12029]|uniref:Phospholipase/carboxylesterase/thioesterase domain-containing protein n=1 Tax=Exidia glandulosa HHB12029 TaxID=1314781 RepID=A0A165Q066_EXIGL|nr:hypothetical protein EXIGLDRAFT_713813 [Exidia glandulosa HHB12029]